jgi:heat-inducible transcriptional repressor
MWVSKRYFKIISCLIDVYTHRFQAVSSEEISKIIGEPSSTLRKDLQELERLGYVTKLRSCSGRVPTNRAIRAYIKEICSGTEDNDPTVFSDLPVDGDFSVFSRHMLFSLARETQAIGFVMLDSVFDFPFRGVQIIKTGSSQVMLVLNGINGMSFSKIFSTKINYNEHSLAQWAGLLSTEFKGKSLNQSIRAIGNRIAKDKDRYLLIYRELLSLLQHNDLNAIDLLYEGESQPWPSVGGNHKELLYVVSVLKEKSTLIRFLVDMRNQEKRGPQVAFGDETPIPGLDDCLFIFSNLFAASRSIGGIGIIGPRYMHYADSVMQVKRFSNFFSKRLTGK